jgi:hypothetical protein
MNDLIEQFARKLKNQFCNTLHNSEEAESEEFKVWVAWVNEHLSPLIGWLPLKSAPKDGRILDLMETSYDGIPLFYSAWWEFDCWYLNDGENRLVEEDTDINNWFWRPVTNVLKTAEAKGYQLGYADGAKNE